MKTVKRPKLNKLEAAQLLDCINAGQTVVINRAPKSMQKGYTDTPLFSQANDTPKLF
jgi:hypothetical protein